MGSAQNGLRRPRVPSARLWPLGQQLLYGQYMLTIASRVEVMNRLGRAMADPTRSRILLSLLDEPGYPAKLARDLELTRTNVSNHLSLSLIHISEPTRRHHVSRMPSSA